MRKHTQMIRIAVVFLALLYTFTFPYFFVMDNIIFYTNSILPLFIFSSTYVFFDFFLKQDLKEYRKTAYPVAILFSFLLMIGKDMTIKREVYIFSLRIISSIILLSLILFYIIAWTWKMLVQYEINTDKKIRKEKDIKIPDKIIIWISFLMAWMPIWLANFPGTLSDTGIQIIEYNAGKISRVFPVLHTLFIGTIVNIGYNITRSWNWGIAICVLIQMMMLAGVFTYIIMYFNKHSASVVSIAVLWVGFAFLPAIQLLCKDLVRDVTFSTFILLFSMLLVKLLNEPETILLSKVKIAIFILISFITINLRNVAIFFYVAVTIIIVIHMLKQKDANLKKVLLIFIVVLFFNGIWNGIILEKISVPTSIVEGVATSRVKETLSVPIQQLVRTTNYSYDHLLPEDIQILNELFPEEFLRNGYNDDNADMAKVCFNVENFEKKPTK